MNDIQGFIEVTGGKVWYRKVGNDLKTPLLILHGGPGSSTYSMQNLEALGENRSIILYDQLGCGNSDRPTDDSLWTLERFVEEVAQVRDGLNLDEVHILGHSWGTTLAASYLLTNPKGVKSIIFSSPCLDAIQWAKDQERNILDLPSNIQEVLRKCEADGTTDSQEYHNAMMTFYKKHVCRIPDWPEAYKIPTKARNEKIYNIMWGPSEFHVKGNLKHFSCVNELKKIKIPALFTCGRYDEATPETVKYQSEFIDKSYFHIFENSAHMPYLEEHDEYIKVMNDFLDKVEK